MVVAVQRRSHVLGVLLVHTENDGLAQRIVFDEARKMLGDGLGTPF